MEFRVLGPLEVVAGGGAVAVGGTRERAILARLLISANQVVTQDALVGDLWPADPPEGAAQALWVYVSRLRKALRSSGGDETLVTRPPGYLLAVDAEAFDAARFEALVRSARDAAGQGHHPEAAERFAAGLALWHGPAYSGIAELPFVQAEAARLTEVRLGALEGRIDADLACGRDHELISELASLTREHPLRERLWALRMTALYRAGRQAEALRTYQELRRYLGEELGIEPSEELRALEGSVLRQDAQMARPQPPAPETTHGVVTFLFTDLVGSTELLDRLGDEAGDELRRRHFSALRQALATHGGVEVKSLGDGLMAAFTSPIAALRCAVEIQQAATGDHHPLSVRVGIHAGEPIAEDDDYFGTPVVVAQRLCGRARGGQILCSALIQGLAGSRAGCTFTTLGGLSLKGFAEPIAACEVQWAAPEAPTALPLPGTLARQDTNFVRPAADMARLEAAWEAARSGRRQLVLLAGEPGIGKTRLSTETARLAHEMGAAVLYGRCEEGMSVPYQPFVEALGTYLRQAPSPALGHRAGELVRLVPELIERMPDLPPPLSADPETERYRLFDAVAAWLAAVAAETPAVLVVEDIHWATAPTLAMLGHLVRSGEPGRLLVIVNYRDTHLDVTSELSNAVADLLRQPDVERLRLHGLDRAGVTAYLEAQARHELDHDGRALAAILHAETAGNPFYLSQLIRHLGETGAVTRSEGRWSAARAPAQVDVPDSVRDVVGQRLARLPDETRETLALAAVQGERFDLRVLVEAAGHPQISVLRALDPAISARLVTEADGPGPGHRFLHALVRHTVYDGLSAAERMELHRATGIALASVAGDLWRDHAAELARHWLAATPHAGAGADDARRTLDYAEEAARRASASLAYEEAAAQLARALPFTELIDDQHRRATMLTTLGEAQHYAGDRSHRQTLVNAARLALQLGMGDLAARAALANQRPLSAFGAVDAERVTLLEEVLQAVGPSDGTIRARLFVSLATELHYSSDRRRYELTREAVAVARRLEDRACLADVLGTAFFALSDPESLKERFQMAMELRDLAEDLDDPVLQVNAGLALFLAAGQQGDVGHAREALMTATRVSEELGQTPIRLRTVFAQAGCAMLEGRFAEAERLHAEALCYGQALGNPDHLGVYHGEMGLTRLLQGRPAEAVEHMIVAVEQIPLGTTRFALALAYAAAGRHGEARDLIDSLGGSSMRAVTNDYLRVGTLMFLGEAGVALGDRELARQIYPELLPFSTQMVLLTGTGWGAVAYCLGLLAALLEWPDEADEHFAAAATIHEAAAANGLLTHIRIAWARLLQQRNKLGDRERARSLATAAADLADELDTPVLAERARELLAELVSVNPQ